MVQIVAAHGLDHYAQSHIAAFGMIQGLVQILGRAGVGHCPNFAAAPGRT
jgi:hypothetical protein